MVSQLLLHVSKCNLLTKTQFGFGKGYSCETSLLSMTDNILSAVGVSKICALVLLDFIRAFYTLNHYMLLATLHYYGLGKNSLSMFKGYLTGKDH